MAPTTTPSSPSTGSPPSPTPRREWTTKTRQVIAPLTTTFTAPSECSHGTIGAGYVSPTNGTYSIKCVAWYNSLSCGSSTRSGPPCLPPGTGAAVSSTAKAAFYSPGLVCPSGWQTAITATAGDKADEFGFKDGIIVSTLLPDETAVVCCPSGLAYFPALPGELATGLCTRQFVTNPVSFLSCDGTSFMDITRTNIGGTITVNYTATNTPGLLTTDAWFAGVQMVAPTIQINRRPQDSSLLPPAPSNATGDSRNNMDSDPSAHISSGGIAGAVVGSVAFVAGLGMLGLWARRRRRQAKKQKQVQSVSGSDDAGYVKPELDSAETPRPELEDTRRHELEAANALNHGSPVELEGNNTRPRVELPTQGSESREGIGRKAKALADT